jgi:hypothetical protein
MRATLSSEAGMRRYPVVLNRETGNLGVLTGNLFVRVHDVAHASALAATYGASVRKVKPKLGLVFLEVVKEGRDLFTIADGLRSDSRVIQADLEIVENLRTPQ